MQGWLCCSVRLLCFPRDLSVFAGTVPMPHSKHWSQLVYWWPELASSPCPIWRGELGPDQRQAVQEPFQMCVRASHALHLGWGNSLAVAGTSIPRSQPRRHQAEAAASGVSSTRTKEIRGRCGCGGTHAGQCGARLMLCGKGTENSASPSSPLQIQAQNTRHGAPSSSLHPPPSAIFIHFQLF